MPAPSPNHLRERAAALKSQEDLLRDQLEFFRENNAVECSSDTDPRFLEEQYFAAASRASNVETDSSALLPTIGERLVPRRGRPRRKRRNNTQVSVATPFPQSFPVDLSRPSVFAKREEEKHGAVTAEMPSSSDMSPSSTHKTVSTEDKVSEKQFQSSASGLTPAQEASSMLAAMSPQQIREAQQAIYETLSPESILFLKQRSSRKIPLQSRSSHSRPSETVFSPGTSQTLTTLSEENELHQNATEAKQREEEVERAKRLWMTDATETVQTQEHVDEVLQKAVEDMGPAAMARFDLDGNILTTEQINAIPTHKGLHHHGSAPECAGYTLADLLILTRSTILSQRVLALKVLSALITSHGQRILEPMLKSDGIRLVFSRFPASETFHRALTNQVAYLEAVECLLRQFGWIEQHTLFRDHYFASKFYSPVLLHENEPSLFSILSERHCIGTLIEIAKARCTASSSIEYSKRALNAVRMIVVSSQGASQMILNEEESTSPPRLLDSLMQLAIGWDKLDPSTTMLSCDIIANIFVNAAWVRKDRDQESVKLPFSEDFLMETAAHLNWVLKDSPFELNSAKQEAAKGVLRLFRAYLSQGCGVQCVSAFLQAICRLVQEADDNIGVEAYLLLEAYVHCLATRIMQTADKPYTYAFDKGSSSNAHAKEPSPAHFAMDHLSGLTPQVVTAAKIVVTPESRHSISRRAAAGHFVATMLTVTLIPFDETYYSQAKCVASEVNFLIAKSDLDTVLGLKDSQTLASLSHAIARILNGKLLERSFASREVELLVNAADREKKSLSKKSGRKGTWRLIANACAEWMGLLSRLESTLSIVQTASVLLSCLSDVQVILDLISRCILRKEILLNLRHATKASEAEQIARKFIPLTWKLINDSGELRSMQLQKIGDPHNGPVLVSLDSLIGLWLKHDGLTLEGLILCQTLFQATLVDNSLLFESLIGIRPNQCTAPPTLFDLILQVGNACFEREGRLITSVTNTKQSSLSTSMDSQFFNSVMNLADQLVARGPMPVTCSRKMVDSLGSIVLSIMCGLEADSTLRQKIWNRCVQECGGAALFKDAVFVQGTELDTTSADTCLEKEDMMHKYVSAIGESFLDPGRCPEIMRRIVLSRLSAYLLFPVKTAALESMLQSLSPASRERIYDKLCHFLAVEGGDSFKSLAKWVQDAL